MSKKKKKIRGGVCLYHVTSLEYVGCTVSRTCGQGLYQRWVEDKRCGGHCALAETCGVWTSRPLHIKEMDLFGVDYRQDESEKLSLGGIIILKNILKIIKGQVKSGFFGSSVPLAPYFTKIKIERGRPHPSAPDSVSDYRGLYHDSSDLQELPLDILTDLFGKLVN